MLYFLISHLPSLKTRAGIFLLTNILTMLTGVKTKVVNFKKIVIILYIENFNNHKIIKNIHAIFIIMQSKIINFKTHFQINVIYQRFQAEFVMDRVMLIQNLQEKILHNILVVFKVIYNM